uniref:Uncharacterized protein n=1 Tax=viral metagenome TaxID=1070528 RepID=A0A6C0KFE7_9ZZZZ
MSDKRTFTVLSVATGSGKAQSPSNNGGKFVSRTPSGAARKATTKICRSKKAKKCALVVTMKETTKGSKNNAYTYHVKRVKDPTTVIRNGVEVNYNYKTEIHAHKPGKKSAKKSRSPKKSAKKSKSPKKSVKKSRSPKKSKSPKKSAKKSKSPKKSSKKSKSPKKSVKKSRSPKKSSKKSRSRSRSH